ncbi:MAG TPA: hypothetical protein PKM41_07160 [Deltaproteobacteria bacterium]|nr:hypothetical protein [Deltaproteobacteria bacterium]HOI06887.1 hypothetical protein [Deltaproteobacteria bacterium]
MAEKELRTEINEIASELEEIRSELSVRLAGIKKKAKPAVLVVVGLIGLKIGLKIAKGVLSLLWKMKSFLLAATLLFVLQLYLSSTRDQSRG